MDIFSREYPVVFLVMKKRASSQTQCVDIGDWGFMVSCLSPVWCTGIPAGGIVLPFVRCSVLLGCRSTRK